MSTIEPTGNSADPHISDIAQMLLNAGYTQPQVNDLLVSMYVSTLQPSEAIAHTPQFYSSMPGISGAGLSNQFDALKASYGNEAVAAFLLTIANTRNEIISDMLDSWSENVATITELMRRDEARQAIIDESDRHYREQSDLIKEEAEAREADPMLFRGQILDAGHFLEYLRDLPLHLREEAISYVDRSENPIIRQNADLAKAILPMVLIETLIIVPAAQGVVMGPVENLSDQIAVNPISDRTVLDIPNLVQMQADMLPLINFFALDMVKTATLYLYVKSVGKGGEMIGDIDFANAFAEQVMSKIKTPGYIEGELLKHVSTFEQLPYDQKEAAIMLTKMHLLGSVLMLFTHIEGGVLSPNELKEMLLEGKGIPQDDQRGAVVTLLRETIATVPEELRGDFVESLLKYLDSMPQREEMTSFVHALNAATAEVVLPEGAV